MDRPSLISLLGVSASPTTAELRHARRFVARRLHPDAAGDRSAPRMADVNAACDRWIAEIRAGTSTPLSNSEPSRPHATQPTHRPSPIDFQMSYAVGTILVAFLTTVLIVMIGGPSVTTVAVGALFGAIAGAAYATVIYLIARR
ncbi:MAG TPA: hypothetical protein VMM60_13075 [Ilumatobacter sp.]|nr:hypothetical protein [Ilumatobacter sp.]